MLEHGDGMRIAHVLWRGGIGGIERFVADLVTAQAALPEVQVGVVFAGEQHGAPGLEACDAPDVAVFAGGMRSTFDVVGPRFAAVVRRLSEADIVHLHGFTPSLALAALLSGRAVVFSEHGMLGHDDKMGTRGWLKQIAKGIYLRRRVVVVACVSAWVRAAAQARYRLDPVRVCEVRNGVRLEAIRARRSRVETLAAEGIDPDAFVIVVTARLVAFKRVERLVTAVGMLPPAGRPWKLLIAGDGPLREGLRGLSARTGVGENVRFLGWRDDVWDLVEASDVTVLPSSREPFGLVVLEAVALGRPVLVFEDALGPGEVLRAVGGGGIVRDVAHLAETLDALRRGDDEQLAPADIELLWREYDIGAVARRYAAVYDCALATHAAGPGGGSSGTRRRGRPVVGRPRSRR